MDAPKTDICALLRSLGIDFERHEHPAVFTVEEAERLAPGLPGTGTKNLFLRDHKGRRHVLVVAEYRKPVDLKDLGRTLNARSLGFGSAERLMTHLGVEPGSVSILALANDGEKRVELVIDREVWEAGEIHAHPLVNTATLVVSMEGIRKFLKATGHEPRVVDFGKGPLIA